MVTTVPTDLRADRERGILTVSWGSELADFRCVFLRGQCECAHCVNEWTGEQILNPDEIPADITIEKMELVGGYAVRIHWSDGHNAGLFTWERLMELRSRL